MRTNSDNIMTVQELAVQLRVKPSWIYRHADYLGAYRLGKYLRFSWNRVLGRLDELSTVRSTLGSQPKGSMLSPVESVALPRLQPPNNERKDVNSARHLHVNLARVLTISSGFLLLEMHAGHLAALILAVEP